MWMILGVTCKLVEGEPCGSSPQAAELLFIKQTVTALQGCLGQLTCCQLSRSDLRPSRDSQARCVVLFNCMNPAVQQKSFCDCAGDGYALHNRSHAPSGDGRTTKATGEELQKP